MDLYSTKIHQLKVHPPIDFSYMFGMVGPIIEHIYKKGKQYISFLCCSTKY